MVMMKYFKPFEYDKVYSLGEITQIAGDCQHGREFIYVTLGNTEYVFREADGGYVIDHTWSAFRLARKDTA